MDSPLRIVGRVAAAIWILGVSCALGCSSSSAGDAVPSGSGESCTRTADCQDGLLCVGNVCRSANGVDAGVGSHFADASTSTADSGSSNGSSGIGQACQTSRDCSTGLACVVSKTGGAVCDLASFGLTPGDKTCGGECSTAADCCDLPPAVSIYTYLDGGYVYAQNCTDIFQGILGGSTAACAGAAQFSTLATACFYYSAYCNCAPSTWACNGGKCQYTAPCHSQYAASVGGCASLSRAGTSLPGACDLTTSTCARTACAVSTDCDGLAIVDRPGGATCRSGDCTCVAGGCYLKCAADTDCDPGYACDTTRSVCSPAACANDAQCFSQLGMARAKCSAGKCGIPCSVDLDCSPSGDLPGQPFNGTVCGPGGTCVPVGCSSNTDCGRSATGARQFCVASPGTIRSATTN